MHAGNVQPVVLAGVVPPPFHGQGIATQALFDADLDGIGKVLVEMRSSTKITEVGRASIGKIFGVFSIVAKVLKGRFTSGARVFYYTAGSGAWVPFFRDLLVLGVCRPFFRTTVIHYHSGNIVDFLEASGFRSALGRMIYGRGAWSIRLGEGCPVPDQRYGAGRVIKVPNGISPPALSQRQGGRDRLRILFLGHLFEEKGVLDLIDAVGLLGSRIEAPLELSMVGAFPDEASEALVRERLGRLDPAIEVRGPAAAYGEEKWDALGRADVLVFPSYYNRENMPLVVIEAMAAGLPVIATGWRGIPELVEDGKTGFLVPPKDPAAIADCLERLMADSRLRESMSREAEARFRSRFTMDRHLEKMGETLREATLA